MIIPVSLGEQSYDIVAERGALSRIGELLPLDRRVLVVTDSGVPAAYAEAVADQCRSPLLFCFPQGEQSKSFDTYRALLSAMLNASFTRRDCVIAVGGGVVGDLAGFAASTYMRGIDFYNIPTTLLSQVDSSIGGKTAIDMEGVKNVVGTFCQPKRVIIDPDTLSTLDPRQVRAGLAEAVKMSLTHDAVLFERIEQAEDLRPIMEEIIIGALQIKRAVVEQDVREVGLRRVLNFGHTIGHAVESAAGGSLLHGECVAIGMLPFCSPKVRERLFPLLRRLGLPTGADLTPEELLPYLLHDKKRQTDGISVVCVEEIGSFVFRELTPDEILSRLTVLRDCGN